MRASATARAVFDALEAQHPGATTELRFRNPFELLVATILSAQTTDRQVNEVTPQLFARYPSSEALAAADVADVERLVRSTGFFRQKARTIINVARALVERHGGQVPADMNALVALPGVGRKTANVVLGHALGVPGLAVDRHVLRVANRLGLAQSSDPDEVERRLTAMLPPERWTKASDTLILHGRRVCTPRPRCDRCSVREACRFRRQAAGVQSSIPPADARPSASPRRAGSRGAARQDRRGSRRQV